MIRSLLVCILFLICSLNCFCSEEDTVKTVKLHLKSEPCTEIKIISDTVFYITKDTVIRLNTDNEASYYLWRNIDGSSLASVMNDTTKRNPTLTIHKNDTVTLVLEAMNEEETGDNLVNNGDFENGNSGFVSDYIYVANQSSIALWNEGRYAIGTNPRNYHSNFSQCTNGGKMLIANGSGVQGTRLYQTTCTVEQNQLYAVSFEATNLTYAPLPKFQFSVNNIQLGDIFEISSVRCQWNKYYQLWNSNNTTSAVLKILNQNSDKGGNDFAVDNIRMVKLCKVYDTVTIISLDCIDTTTLDIAVCEGEKYDFYGETLDKSGTYTKILKRNNDCDNLILLNLAIKEHSDTLITAEFCSGDVYQQDGFTVTETGVYTRTEKNINGCDSVITLDIKTIPTKDTVLNEHICKGESFFFNNQQLFNSGNYSFKTKSFLGCDSTVNLNLNVDSVYEKEYYGHICHSEQYEFNSKVLTAAGTYTDSLKTVNGCDSIIILHLTVYPVYDSTIDTAICEGEGFVFSEDTLQQAGYYKYMYKSLAGCDSVINLNLTIYPKAYSEIEKTICQGQYFEFEKDILNTQGEYLYKKQTENGCDSIVKLTLNVVPAYESNESVEICNGQQYEFSNRILTQSGIYTDTLKSEYGCDSIKILTLTVKEESDTIINAVICSGNTYSDNGFNETNCGIYTKKEKNIYGCDSVITLNLTVDSSYLMFISETICKGTPFIWRDKTLIHEGIYTDTFTTLNGCDSIIILNLVVIDNYEIITHATICSNESYLFDGRTLTEAGIYREEYKTEEGCDSIITLILTVNPIYSDTIFADIEEGTIYDRNGFNETQEGIYYHYNTSIFGCDSNTVLLLNINTLPIIWMPNAINPADETEINRNFRIFTDDADIQLKSFNIFDRWGTVMFETDDIEQSWNGTFKGKYVQAGVYFYDITYCKITNKNKVYRQTGQIIVFY